MAFNRSLFLVCIGVLFLGTVMAQEFVQTPFGYPNSAPDRSMDVSGEVRNGGLETDFGTGPNMFGLDSRHYVETKIGTLILRASSKIRREFKSLCVEEKQDELIDRIMESYTANSSSVTDFCNRSASNAASCDAEKICTAFSKKEIPFPQDVKRAAQEAGISLTFPMTSDQVVGICKLMAGKEIGREQERMNQQLDKEVTRFREQCNREKEFETQRQQQEEQRRQMEQNRWNQPQPQNNYPQPNQPMVCGPGTQPDGRGGGISSQPYQPPQNESPPPSSETPPPSDSPSPPAEPTPPIETNTGDSGASTTSGEEGNAAGIVDTMINWIPNTINGFLNLELQESKTQQPLLERISGGDGSQGRTEYESSQYGQNQKVNCPAGEYPDPNRMGNCIRSGTNPQYGPQEDRSVVQQMGGPGRGPLSMEDCSLSDDALKTKMKDSMGGFGPSDDEVSAQCAMDAQTRVDEMERMVSEMEFRQEACILNYGEYCDFKEEITDSCMELSTTESVKQLVTDFVSKRCQFIVLKSTGSQQARGLLKSALDLYTESENSSSETFGSGFETAAFDLSKKQEEIDQAKQKVGVIEVITGDSKYSDEIKRINLELDQKIGALEALKNDLPADGQDKVNSILEDLTKQKQKLTERAQAFENPINILGRIGNMLSGAD